MTTLVSAPRYCGELVQRCEIAATRQQRLNINLKLRLIAMLTSSNDVIDPLVAKTKTSCVTVMRAAKKADVVELVTAAESERLRVFVFNKRC